MILKKYWQLVRLAKQKTKTKNAVIVNDHLGHSFFTSRLKADVPSTVVQIQVVQLLEGPIQLLISLISF